MRTNRFRHFSIYRKIITFLANGFDARRITTDAVHLVLQEASASFCGGSEGFDVAKHQKLNDQCPTAQVRFLDVALLLGGILTAGAPGSCFAIDIGFKLLSANFGGTTPMPCSYARYEFSQKTEVIFRSRSC
jgi:hypothetical protein